MTDHIDRTTTFSLDEAVASRPLGDGRHAVTITDAYHNLIGTPSGAYVLALLLTIAQRESERKDPLSISVNFLRPAEAGSGEVRVSALRHGSGISTYAVELVQGDQIRAQAVTTMHEWSSSSAVEATPHTAPSVKPPEACDDPLAYVPDSMWQPINNQYDVRVEQTPGWILGEPDGVMHQLGWIRAADSRAIDAALAASMTDAFPPVTANIGAPLSTTVQMVVYFRRRPTGGVWALTESSSRHVIGGHSEEDVELWDESGLLIAQSRQLCKLL